VRDCAGFGRLRQVEEEHSRLKRLVADLSLDQPVLPETCEQKSKARPAGNRPNGFMRRFR